MHGTRVAMYIVGQEETVGESSVSVVAGVRTVTTKNGWARRTPTFVAPIRFSGHTFQFQITPTSAYVNVAVSVNLTRSVVARVLKLQ